MYNDHNVQSLHVMLPKTSTYVKSYDGQTKWMYFLIENDDLLEKYNTIWDKVSAYVKKEFDRELVYKFFENSFSEKSYGDDVTDFYEKEILKVGSNRICLGVISLDSTLNKDGNYYDAQVFLKV